MDYFYKTLTIALILGFSTSCIAAVEHELRVPLPGIKILGNPFGGESTAPKDTLVKWDSSQMPTGATVSSDGLTTSVPGFYMMRATVGKSEGTWYWEVVPTSAGTMPGAGVATLAAYTFSSVGAYSVYGTGYYCWNGCNGMYPWAQFKSGDVLGFALNATTRQMQFYVNGSYRQTVPVPAGVVYPIVGGPSTSTYLGRFNSSSWTYAPPLGYLPLQ